MLDTTPHGSPEEIPTELDRTTDQIIGREDLLFWTGAVSRTQSYS